MSKHQCHITHFSSNRFTDLIREFSEYRFDSVEPVELNPVGCFELIVQTGCFSQKSIGEGNWQKRPQVFIGGLHNASFAIKPESSEASLISIKFKPGAARHFIPERLGAFQNKLVSANDLFSGEQLRPLEFHEKADFFLKQEKIEAFLNAAFKPGNPSPIDRALTLIHESMGCIPVAELARLVSLSRSRFRQRFLAEVGLAPKAYSRVVRVNAITTVLNFGKRTKLTDLAYRFDYFDQAHFIKDFQAIVGLTPSEYLRRRN